MEEQIKEQIEEEERKKITTNKYINYNQKLIRLKKIMELSNFQFGIIIFVVLIIIP